MIWGDRFEVSGTGPMKYRDRTYKAGRSQHWVTCGVVASCDEIRSVILIHSGRYRQRSSFDSLAQRQF
jgi:hypothetical protein